MHDKKGIALVNSHVILSLVMVNIIASTVNPEVHYFPYLLLEIIISSESLENKAT